MQICLYEKVAPSEPSNFASIGFSVHAIGYVIFEENMFSIPPEPLSGAAKQIWPQNTICNRDRRNVIGRKGVDPMIIGHLFFKGLGSEEWFVGQIGRKKKN